MEIFKDLPGYESLYQVSNLGNVKSLNYRGNNIAALLKPGKNSKGYLCVALAKNKVLKNCTVHSLVAMTFLNHKPNGFDIVVDHIDGNKTNNNVKNLQLVSMSMNTKKKINKSNKYSMHKGVSWNKNSNKWRAYIFIDKKEKHLGYYINEIEAINVVKMASL